ncbi:MAG: DUF2723 domain-containing protein [Rubricoccaceae bacterium]
MTGKLIDRLVAAAVFLYALVLYWMTMAETSPFWDSGEFIAISNGLQVSHPPGAPFYMLVGRFFSMFSGIFSGLSPEPVAYAVNLMSVLASAATILLAHLILLRLVRIWTGHPDTWTPLQRIAANAGGVIGALAFAATDSFWFNAVEAEVYAMSMLFTALVVWLALVWRDATRAEEADLRARGEHPFGLHADRYLVAIAYLFGLAIGVHLLNVLTLFFIALIIYFQKVEAPEATMGQRIKGIAITAVVSSVLFLMIYPGIVQILPDLAERSKMPLPFMVLLVSAMVGLVWWTQKTKRPVGNLLALTVTMVMIGYSSYAVIFIRSAADPPIDENDPETTEAIVSYLKREQYGNTPLLTGNTFNDRTGQIDARESSFPRRYSSEPTHLQKYAEYSSDMDYFLSYQLGHMYWRYFMWQFVGKAGDYQDAGWMSGLSGKGDMATLTPSEQAGRNAYWGLPLLLGLLGLAFHFSRDWRRALAVLVLFLITGVGIIVYLNQYPFQPRERDYAYVASFFAFSLWIGIGATGLIQLASEALASSAATVKRGAAIGLAALMFVAVPGWMAVENYDDHDRSGRRIATDFARNLLESTAPNAILFTNGDNDTFPLWYLQEVEGIRRDVRVVNLSLLQTPWYVKQLKNQASRESAPIPMTMTDEQVDGIRASQFNPQLVSLPVDPRAFVDERIAGRVDTSGMPRQMTWQLNGRAFGEGVNVLYPNDIAVLDILKAVAEEGWTRPVYFASTVAPDSELDLQPFFQNEGLARRIVPIRRDTGDPDGVVVPEIVADRLGKFQFQGLDDPEVYHDENARNMADGYRTRFATIAMALAQQGRESEALELLDRIREAVPTETIPSGFASLYTLAQAYQNAGRPERTVEILKDAEALAFDQLDQAERSGNRQQQNTAAQYLTFIQQSYLMGGLYEEAAAFSSRLAVAAGDPAIERSLEEIQQQAEAMERAMQPQDSLSGG